MNFALYRKELKRSWKLLLIFGAVLTMYISMIISMYDPKMADAMKQFEELMPEVMAAFGMMDAGGTLGSFMSSYLYGMILLVFPMVYSILRAHALVVKYVDHGSMAALLAAPVKRKTIALTQLAALLSGVLFLMVYCTGLEYLVARGLFPGELPLAELLRLNAGLLGLQLFLACYCFFCSCTFGESKYSLLFGAGLPVLMYVLQMLANMGGKLENVRYATIFTLFDAEGLLNAQAGAGFGAAALFVLAVLFAGMGVVVFCRKDLHV